MRREAPQLRGIAAPLDSGAARPAVSLPPREQRCPSARRRRRSLAQAHPIGDRLAGADAIGPRSKQAEPGDPVLLLVGLTHALDQRRVLHLLCGADDEGTALVPDPDVERASARDPLSLPAVRRRREEDLAVLVREPDRRDLAPLTVLPLRRDVDELRL